MEKRIRLVIADDHPLVTEGFCSVIGRNYRDIEVVAAVSNGKEAVEEEARLEPDVILMDIKMPVMDGISAVREIRRRKAEAKIIILTTYDEKSYVQGAIDEGAAGFVLKDTPISDVVLAIRAVYKGNVIFPRDIMQLFTEQSGEKDSNTISVGDIDRALPHKELNSLSHREKEVLVLMARGLTNPEIADRLCIGDGTVRNYVHKIYDVIGVHNRTAVVLWAFEHGIH
jgi:DNA-binding NarL/FixJ family response regulator